MHYIIHKNIMCIFFIIIYKEYFVYLSLSLTLFNISITIVNIQNIYFENENNYRNEKKKKMEVGFLKFLQNQSTFDKRNFCLILSNRK